MKFKKGQIPWNKNTKGIMKKNSSSFKKGVYQGYGFKKGEHKSSKNEFKKSMVPWNKGKNRSEATKNKIRNSYYHKNHKREKSSAWKGGITPLVIAIRSSKKYAEWRKAVFERDNYTCQLTGIRGSDLEVHHKKSFAKILEDNNIKEFEDALNCKELWDINNGITLTKEQHAIIDYHRRIKQK